ncbi:hypothetical protein [Rhodoblastus sp.]|uniref:hypothetical protein n=1 Tax=Rhodoblastus sp. TaxID=1962975 RepID=UPI003F951E0C
MTLSARQQGLRQQTRNACICGATTWQKRCFEGDWGAPPVSAQQICRGAAGWFDQISVIMLRAKFIK